MSACRLARISLTVRDLNRSVSFYRDALGFTQEGEETRGGEAFARTHAIEGATARVARLALGAEHIELFAFDPPGLDYPADSRSTDLWFQHFAIVVSDIDAACARVAGLPVAPISRGPQKLPPGSGGVDAFKFRDPDGHPLEFLAFPAGGAPARWQKPGLFLGIDHSAIAVADTGRSEAFYVGLLGLHVGARSLNKGVEQERLDATFNAVVEVTGLEIGAGEGPHVELLCYRVPPTGRPIPRTTLGNDIAATRLVFETGDLQAIADEAAEKRMQLISPGVVDDRLTLRDPDGHLLIFEAP